jgi:hypothetical protein
MVWTLCSSRWALMNSYTERVRRRSVSWTSASSAWMLKRLSTKSWELQGGLAPIRWTSSEGRLGNPDFADGNSKQRCCRRLIKGNDVMANYRRIARREPATPAKLLKTKGTATTPVGPHSNPPGPFRINNLRILRCQGCQQYHGCHGALHAIARRNRPIAMRLALGEA